MKKLINGLVILVFISINSSSAFAGDYDKCAKIEVYTSKEDYCNTKVTNVRVMNVCKFDIKVHISLEDDLGATTPYLDVIEPGWTSKYYRQCSNGKYSVWAEKL
ncbi:hypothetical protein OR1_03489 [Geobacter sp. OR-1]|uniref:hypothetical protein n=1 Tax=Geobacter sp. OR-1 TaxID=1266765 RepID=UPI0005443761|nr:hypothetical protein [Geobacter sp. OR-1]GAM11179.1 hypothetical protein OR1_03489 [Geobacter sp. OR-1]